MQYRLLGRSGLRVSSVCLGTAFFGITPLEDGVDALVGRALDLGITFFDTANSYGNQTRFDRPGIPPAAERKSSEELLGRALKGRHRYDVIVATKVQEKMAEGPNDGGPAGGGLTRKHIVAQCEQSLRRLQTDYIDVYYAHHPDPTTPLDQTLRAFDELVKQGKVRYPALSNFASWQLIKALWLCSGDGDALQPDHALDRARGGARLSGVQRRHYRLQPPRQRPADRHVPARRSAAARLAGLVPAQPHPAVL
jgi:aryl-alcohol dehydrogenase-like predicted oxidoreductase